jgi:hypothetical protein
MKTTINFSQFCDEFKTMGRDNSFSYEGKKALFDYLEQLEEDTGDEIELDVIALCCDYSEYSNIKEFQCDYSTEYETIEDIENETIVIKIDDEAFIIQQF